MPPFGIMTVSPNLEKFASDKSPRKMLSLHLHRSLCKKKKGIARVLIAILALQIVMPLRALALTSGPTQPEFQGFSPLATTSLVDPFSGDFSYNIPLLNIDGYPLNLIYRATSNMEEEGSWVGYGWNVNVGTLNRLVRGLPDDMNGDSMKIFQNIRERTVKSTTIGVEGDVSARAALNQNVGARVGIQASASLTFDNDNYIGRGVGLAIGGGVYAGVNIGPFNAGGNAGVTLSASSNHGGTISTYAGFNAGFAFNNYMSAGFGKSYERNYNTISGWEKPNIIGSLNISHVTQEIQRSFLGSISNAIPLITNPYHYHSSGIGYKLKLGVSANIIQDIGIGASLGLSYTENKSTTTYANYTPRKGYGYMYMEKAPDSGILDFSRDNDGGINKNMPFVPPAIKTYDVFSSTAHDAVSTFHANRTDGGTVRDPETKFGNSNTDNETHQIDFEFICSWDCWVGIRVGYENKKNWTSGAVSTGACADDKVLFQGSNGKQQNLTFRPCGEITQSEEGNGKRRAVKAPIQVYTNKMIAEMPQTVLHKDLKTYAINDFPINTCFVTALPRPASDNAVTSSKIGGIVSMNEEGKSYVYGTPVNNNIKNEVAFRLNGFRNDNYDLSNGLTKYDDADETQYNGKNRDRLYKSTRTPSYATSYLLNAVLSPDYVDVTNNGLTDDDLGGFVKFNYTKADNDYRWRAPYCHDGENTALLNEGVKLTKFDDMGSYMSGSKELWYAHSIESKNNVVEFYLSSREDAKDTKKRIMPNNYPTREASDSLYVNDKPEYSHMMKLDSIKYYSKHDRYINGQNAVPIKTIYFDYDYSISSALPNADNGQGKLALRHVRVRHGNEPISSAEKYDFDYAASNSTHSNPIYSLGAKDGWGNYQPNTGSLNLCEFPYIDQTRDRATANDIASAFHLTKIQLPSGGTINIDYESDDYAYVQNRPAMAFHKVLGVGASPAFSPTDAHGLYSPGSANPNLYIYVEKPKGIQTYNYMNTLLNGSNMMYFSFNVNIGGNAFSTYDQVKGYGLVDEIGDCPGNGEVAALYIKMRPVSLTGTNIKPSPITNTAINMARAYATDQLYFQEGEDSSGLNHNQGDRLGKAGLQLKESLFGKNAIDQLMRGYGAGRYFNKDKSYVKLTIMKPKVGGGSRVSKLTFSDDWHNTISTESSSLIGYKYHYVNEDGTSSGVASYEPIIGGEENPLRSGQSYALSDNPSSYPPYDPIEMIKEDPPGESFFPTGGVGYSRVVTESIHRDSARSAQSLLVQEFYTAKDFPLSVSYSPKYVEEIKDTKFPDPDLRDILLSFIGISNTISSSRNSYSISQSFSVELNDMHGKPKSVQQYRLLLKNNKKELISSTEYFYNTNGNSGLSNDVPVLQHASTGTSKKLCSTQGELEKAFPKNNIYVTTKTLGVDVEECTDSREVVSIEQRKLKRRGGSIEACFPTGFSIGLTWVDNMHTHVDYFKSLTSTRITNRYGILQSVKTINEGAETIVENKYYDAITGAPVVQIVKDKYGDDVYRTNIPAYWTKTDLEPSYQELPYAEELNTPAWSFTPSLFPSTPSYIPVVQHDKLILPDSLRFGLSNTGMICTHFETEEDMFHPGDELFVYGKYNKASTSSNEYSWHRLYVTEVLVKKDHYGGPDPLAWRYGNNTSTGVKYRVNLTPHKVRNPLPNELASGSDLKNISKVFKYRSGRKNMLHPSSGSIAAFKEPFAYEDSLYYDTCMNRYSTVKSDTVWQVHNTSGGGSGSYTYYTSNNYGGTITTSSGTLTDPMRAIYTKDTGWRVWNATTWGGTSDTSYAVNNQTVWTSDTIQLRVQSFLKPVIDASASRYGDIRAIPFGNWASLLLNPISMGIINQPYVSHTYALAGKRQDPSNTMLQRKNGILTNWYYWLPARLDSSGFVPRVPLLSHGEDALFSGFISKDPNAWWNVVSEITKAMPELGAVEEMNPLGIFSAIFLDPITKQLLHATSNGKFGQTWVESFEDMQRVRVMNELTDLFLSPLQSLMETSKTDVPGYEVFKTTQSTFRNTNDLTLTGSFTLESDESHTGIYSMGVSGNASLTIKPKKHTTNQRYYTNSFDFNLDDVGGQKYTCEVWAKGASNVPSVNIANGTNVSLAKVSNEIDGWSLYRAEIEVSDGNAVTFNFPNGKYDDLRVYPSGANTKSYVYHPYKNYLMAILDENNYATFYEYDVKDRLIRLKKETEKGILTITENIKNQVKR